MKNYDPNSRRGTHTIKASPQRRDYKGFVTFRGGGNCKGLDVPVLDEDDLYDQKLTDNPIGFGLLPEDDQGNEWFKTTLMNDNGDELSVEGIWSYLSDYIVNVEIIEFVVDREERRLEEQILQIRAQKESRRLIKRQYYLGH